MKRVFIAITPAALLSIWAQFGYAQTLSENFSINQSVSSLPVGSCTPTLAPPAHYNTCEGQTPDGAMQGVTYTNLFPQGGPYIQVGAFAGKFNGTPVPIADAGMDTRANLNWTVTVTPLAAGSHQIKAFATIEAVGFSTAIGGGNLAQLYFDIPAEPGSLCEMEATSIIQTCSASYSFSTSPQGSSFSFTISVYAAGDLSYVNTCVADYGFGGPISYYTCPVQSGQIFAQLTSFALVDQATGETIPYTTSDGQKLGNSAYPPSLLNSSGASYVVGDVNGDGRVDQHDLALITVALNKPATGPTDPLDLNHDGVINALDARLLVTFCTRPGCAVQ
jgi:hypothetical protein